MAKKLRISKPKELNITQDRVIMIIERTIELKGLGEAVSMFEHMNSYFSAEPGWAETAEKVYELFANERKKQKKEELKEHQRQHREKLEVARAGAPFVKNINHHSSTDARRIDQFNNLIEEGAEVGYYCKNKK